MDSVIVLIGETEDGEVVDVEDGGEPFCEGSQPVV